MPEGRIDRITSPSDSHVLEAYRTVARSAPIAMILSDSAGTILFSNSLADSLFAYEHGELEGQPLEILLPPESRDRHRHLRSEYHISPQTRSMYNRPTLQGLRKDGTRLPLAIGLATVGDGMTLSTIADRSESIRVDAEYRALFENAPYGIYRSSAGGRFLTVNRALVEMLGYDSAEELLRVNMGDDLYLDASQRRNLVEHRSGTNRIEDVELEWKRKDGSVITVRLSGRPVANSWGEVESFEMMVEDVTGTRELEAQLRQAQKMEAVGQLSGGIAHDINNVLTVVIANAEHAIAAIAAGETDTANELTEIKDAALKGSEMVRKLLAFSRKGVLHMKVLDLGKRISGMTDLLKRLVPESIRFDVQCEAAPTVRVDPGAVEQVLINLVTNARDAMSGAGSLTVSVGERTLGREYQATHPWIEPGDYTYLAVADTGCGITETAMARMFEPFFTTKPPSQGTGLGMAMVYGLVKQQNGHVIVESELGRGTRVSVFFPAVRGIAAEELVPMGDVVLPVTGGSETILVAEDEAAIRRVTKRALEAHGYRVLVAVDGAEALELYRDNAEEIDLILTDLVMPRLSGRDLYDALQQEGIAVPVIFTSGYSAGEASLSRNFETDLPFITKPWTIHELLTGIRRALDVTDPGA